MVREVRLENEHEHVRHAVGFRAGGAGRALGVSQFRHFAPSYNELHLSGLAREVELSGHRASGNV